VLEKLDGEGSVALNELKPRVAEVTGEGKKKGVKGEGHKILGAPAIRKVQGNFCLGYTAFLIGYKQSRDLSGQQKKRGGEKDP